MNVLRGARNYVTGALGLGSSGETRCDLRVHIVGRVGTALVDEEQLSLCGTGLLVVPLFLSMCVTYIHFCAKHTIWGCRDGDSSLSAVLQFGGPCAMLCSDGDLMALMHYLSESMIFHEVHRTQCYSWASCDTVFTRLAHGAHSSFFCTMKRYQNSALATNFSYEHAYYMNKTLHFKRRAVLAAVTYIFRYSTAVSYTHHGPTTTVTD